MDQGHIETEKLLVALEKRIEKIYGEASKEMQKKADAYFAQFVQRDKHQQDLLKAGKITEQEYKQWRLTQMGRGERFIALRDDLAKRMTEANKVAVAYINDETPSIYSLNHNYAAYEIEKVSGNVGFTLYDEQTVKRLIEKEPNLMPKRRVNAPKDLKWNKKKFQAEITAGILQGESIGHIANRVQNLSDANRSGAIRNARTAVTGAQNAGRQESYTKAKEMGLKLEKRWIATKDNRTRHEHAILDGQTVPLDKPFEIDGHKLMYPGDPAGLARLVWNCRCTMRTVEKGDIEAEPRQMRVRNPETGLNELISEITYAEWQEWKKTGVIPEPPKQQKPKMPSFVPAKTIQEAEEYARQNIFSGAYLGKTSYKGIDVDMANGINETLERITQKYGRKLSGIEVVNPKTAKGLKALGGSADAPFATNSLNGMVYINKDIIKNAKALRAYTDKGNEAFRLVMANKDKLSGKMRTLAEIYEKAGKDLVDSSLEGMVTHEYGHYLVVSINPKADVVSKIADGMGDHLVSGYSQHNVREYLAECFTEYERGDRSKIDPIVIELFEGAIKQ